MLTDLLGGTVGCSRAVTSLGWRPHADQFGQTGTRIVPELYIACGVSGAIQHMVGAKGAKRLLPINTDPEAPIVAQADYAIIGDLHKVIWPYLWRSRRKGNNFVEGLATEAALWLKKSYMRSPALLIIQVSAPTSILTRPSRNVRDFCHKL
ncbi:MAG: electron transfer flavoprotein subunit alpha/FixB family protein [Chloroflexi bacterium]|nr:electron transfer flavoprotein subunit alpha/FixB family protein [Chloroflexota bacterium]